jgi:hypothetical protein
MKTIVILLIIGAASFCGYKYIFSSKIQNSPQTPPPRLALLGTFYVKDKISITTEDGITSLLPGKMVTLIRESGNNLIVTDGTQEVEVAKTSLTNDLDILDGIISQNANQQKQIAANASLRDKVAIENIKKLEEDILNEQERLNLEITEMTVTVNRLNRELEAVKRVSQSCLTKRPTKTQIDLEQNIASINQKIIWNNEQITDLRLKLQRARFERQSK